MNGIYTGVMFSQLNSIGNGNHYTIKLDKTNNCNTFKNTDEDGKTQYAVSFINRLNSHYEQQDGDPANDSTELGGQHPISIQEVQREIQLKLRRTVRKYDISN